MQFGENVDEYFHANQVHWDQRVDVHLDSVFYDVDAFLGGRCPLKPADLELMGDVAGKRLVHLQCHFGLDTLGWARRGAHVTGLDFSPKAVQTADWLAMRAGLPARFVEANVYDAVEALGQTYEAVVTGVGALCWLPDIRRWAKVVSSLLEPGGVFVLRELHPVLYTIDEKRTDNLLVMRYPYYEGGEVFVDDDQGTYADRDAKFDKTRSYCWNHGVAEVVQALLDAGLMLERIEEYVETDWLPLPHHGMVRGDHGMWTLPGKKHHLPMMLGVRARKGSVRVQF